MNRRIALLLMTCILLTLALPTFWPYPCFKAPCTAGRGCQRFDTACQEREHAHDDDVHTLRINAQFIADAIADVLHHN